MQYVIVGLGSAGYRHLRGLLTLGEQVSAVADPRISLLQDRIPAGAAGYESPEECIRTHAKDAAVIVASPTDYHASQSMLAIDSACKALLVEKPLTVSAEESHRVADAAGIMGVRGAVGYNYRYHSATASVIKALSGSEGSSVFTIACREDPSSWPTESGDHLIAGTMLRTSISHAVDLALLIASKIPDLVVGSIGDTDSVVRLYFKLGSKSVFHFIGFFKWHSPPASAHNFLIWTGVTANNSVAIDMNHEDMRRSAGEMHLSMLKDFVTFAKGKEAPRLCTLGQAAIVDAILKALQKSSDKSEPVEIKTSGGDQ